MTMKIRVPIYLLCLLYLGAACLYADPTVIGEITNTHGKFALLREADSNSTTLTVRFNEESTAVWTKTWQNSADGQNLLNFWQIVDGYSQGTSIAVLLGMHRGLLWIQATKISGLWQINFTQEIYGAASREQKTASIKLRDLDTIIVTNTSGTEVAYTRNASGQLFKDGTPFSSVAPGISITKP